MSKNIFRFECEGHIIIEIDELTNEIKILVKRVDLKNVS
jgi:hypothetical protein